MKYIVIFREHNKMQLETMHIGPFNTWEEAHEVLCSIPALGHHEYDSIKHTSSLSGVKYVEPIYETYEEALAARTPMSEEDIDAIQEHICFAR